MDIPFFKYTLLVDSPKSNIFVIDKPTDEVCKRFQLSCFFDFGLGENELAHIIIFPSHTEESMREIIKAYFDILYRESDTGDGSEVPSNP